MRRSHRRLISRHLVPAAVCLSLAAAFGAEDARAAGADVTGEDYRLFCGYLDALEQPKVKAIKSEKKRDQRIARMAKLSVKKLKAAVEKVEKLGATCDEVGKKMEADALVELKKALPGRVAVYQLDYSDPDHVVALLTWKGGDKKQLEEEAALVAKTISDASPIVRTIAVRGVNPLVQDSTADEATWFEAKITRDRAARIDPKSIKDFADTRYIRLFDNVVRKYEQ